MVEAIATRYWMKGEIESIMSIVISGRPEDIASASERSWF